MTKKQYRDLLARLSPQTRRVFLEAIRGSTNSINFGNLVAAIRGGDVETALRLLNFNRAAFSELREQLRLVFRSAGRLQMLGHVVLQMLGLQPTFNVGVIRAQRTAEQLGSTMIRETLDSTQAEVRAVIGRGIAQGRDPRETAHVIAGALNPNTGNREGGLIGLTRAQAGWARNAEAELLGADRDGVPDPAYFQRDRRDKRFDPMVRQAIEAKTRLDPNQVDKMVRFYRSGLLDMRANAIARTETMSAANAGRYEAIWQMVEGGYVQQEAVSRIWSTRRDLLVRDAHTTMEGQKQPLDQPFQSPTGALLRYPGDSLLGAGADDISNCRCEFEVDIDWKSMQRRGFWGRLTNFLRGR